MFDENKQRARAEEVYRKILAFAPGDADAIQFLGGNAPVTTPAQIAAAAPKAINWTGDMPALRPPGDPRMTGAMPCDW